MTGRNSSQPSGVPEPVERDFSNAPYSTDLVEPMSIAPADSDMADTVPEIQGESVQFEPDWRFIMIFVTIAIITLFASLDATSLSVALPTIAAQLEASAIEVFWAGTSFLLTSSVFQPVFASTSHIYGRKPALFIALSFFAGGALIAALSNHSSVLLVGRSIQGVGGGGVIILCEIIVTDLIPLRQRGTWFGCLSSMWAIGSVTGPIMGGAFAQKVSWRWIFYVNLPVIGVAIVSITIFLKLKLVVGSFEAKLMRVDWIGIFLFTASTTSILIPISWGGVMFPWDSWHTLVPLILGVAGGVLFVLYERLFAKEPIMPFRIFENRDLCITYFTTVFHGIILWSLLYYLPLYYEAVKGYSPIITGIAVFPQTFTVGPAAVLVGIVVSLKGRYRWAIWSGWAISTLGLGLLYLMNPNTSVPAWIFLNLVSGLGLGLLFPSNVFSIQAAIDPKYIAFGLAYFSFFRSFGNAIGIAVGGVVFQNQFRDKILKYPLLAPMADAYSHDISALVQTIQSMADGDAKTQLIQTYADALKVIWILLGALSAVAGLASLFLKGYTLDQVLVSEQGINHKKKQAHFEGQVASDRELT